MCDTVVDYSQQEAQLPQRPCLIWMMPFKVTQGHPLFCQSTWHIWLPISAQ